MLVGQNKLKAKVKEWEEHGLPKLIILQGADQSGKRSFAEYIAKECGFECVHLPNTSETVTSIAAQSLRPHENKVVYIFRDCQNMPITTQMLFLKLVEMGSDECSFILTTTTNTYLPLESRAVKHYMEPYTQEELQAFAVANKTSEGKELKVLPIHHSPTELMILDETVLALVEERVEVAFKLLGTSNYYELINALKTISLNGHLKYFFRRLSVKLISAIESYTLQGKPLQLEGIKGSTYVFLQHIEELTNKAITQYQQYGRLVADNYLLDWWAIGVVDMHKELEGGL